MDQIVQDVRYALRAFVRRPLVAAGAVVSLAIGMAATTIVFGVVNGVLLKPVPGVARPERLVEIARDVGGTGTDVTFPVYRHLRGQSAVLDDLAALALAGVSVSAGGEPSVRGALVVTENYFPLLGVRAERGRLFAPDEARYPTVAQVAVVSHEVWRRELNGSENAVGSEIRVNGTPVRVIGILPQGFAGHHTGLLIDVYLPLGMTAPGLPAPATLDAGNSSSVELLGRLRHGVSRTQAMGALSQAADIYGRQAGESTAQRPYAVMVAHWGPLPYVVRPMVTAFLSILFVLVALALAMACMNVSTILLAQAVERQRELAVRRAIGASEGRLVRQLVTEMGVLFVVAGVIGAGLATWATGLITAVEPPVPIPGRLGADFSVDARVMLFSLALPIAAALAFSLVPALHSSRFSLVPALKEVGSGEARSRARLRSALVGAQVALTCVLLSATLLFGRALASMRSLDPGWNGDGVVVAPVDLEMNGTPAEQGPAKQQRMLEQLEGIPGVELASLATKLPIGGRSSFGFVRAPGVEAPNGLPGFPASLNRVSSGYFRTMRIPLLKGRDISASDDAGAPKVAVINATMAARVFGGADPVGSSFFIGEGSRRLEFRVVGIVADAQLRTPGQAPENFYYVPAAQWYNAAVVLHVRARPGVESSVAAAVRDRIRVVDPSLPVPVVRPLNEALETYLMPQRLAAWVSAAMGAFGLLLALVGVYGLTAFLVSRRAREMAIRMALGASTREVIRLIVVRGAHAPLVGMAAGVVLAAALTVGASQVVTGARAGDPVALTIVPLLLAVASALAMLTPVRRLLRSSISARLRDD